VSVTWLHISDFHVRGGDPYDRDVVLRALVESVAEYRKRGRSPDLIFATGDIAHGGKPEEYEIAGKFFDELLAAVNLPKSSLFIIPGNHDVNRDFGVGLARTLESREDADKYFNPDRPKPHLTLKMRAFLDWHNRYFPADRALAENTTCSLLPMMEVNGRKLGILLINSALFCQDDEDHAKLWVGRRCLNPAIADLKKLGAELNIALIHHPLEWLSATEGGNIQAALEESVHILLRGHLHEARIETVVSPEGQMLRCAAGAAYQSRKWPNRAFYATLDGDRLTIYPIKYEDAPRPLWTTDASVFPRDTGHERTFAIQGKGLERPAVPVRRESAPLRFRSNIGSRGNSPFVGRDELINQISRTLDDPNTERVVVLHGHAGVGKSELALEFARRNRERYGGGTFQVDASTDAVAIHLAAIGKNNLDLDFPPDLPLNDQGLRTFLSLGAGPALLIYDNVVSFERIAPWLPLSGMPCHVIMTTLSDIQTVAWPCIEVPPLLREQALELVKELAGNEIAERYGPAIVEHAGGLPVQIVPETTTLAYERRRGHRPAAGPAIAREAGDSFSRAYQRLEQPARLLLQAAAILNPQRIPLAELSRHLREGLSWSEADVARALDTCLDLHLLSGTPDPSMHQLFGKFLRETAVSADDRAALERVRAAQRKRFVKLGALVSKNPADTQNAATLISYPMTPEAWVEVDQLPSTEEGEAIGRALYEIGRFQEAQPWFERAVAEKEKGDVNGRIDHASLGASLHLVGYCLSNRGRCVEARPWFARAVTETEKGDTAGGVDHALLGACLYGVGRCLSDTEEYEEAQLWFRRAVAESEKGDLDGCVEHDGVGKGLHQVGYCLLGMGQHAEARSWFERAVAEKEKPDIHGRIDHDSLSKSLHQVGYCLSSMGRHAEARPWFDRAVAENEKGDVHGRIDSGSLGRSLHLVGYCLLSMGQHAEARSWYERAAAEAEKGDVHGRIDHESLGISLHSVGYCLSRMGQDVEALRWYERAVAAGEKGDKHGRVDHASLGATLRDGARCLRKLGKNGQADEWEQSASREGQLAGGV
jgi:tetratricopeptide (TPR) repeat protein/predicted MPP superfamily phosphohydrolase